MTGVLSLDAPSVSTVQRQNFDARGMQIATVSGSQFSTLLRTQMSRFGDSGCESSGWVSETSIQCKASHGTKGTRRVVITAVFAMASATQLISYQPATVLTPHFEWHGMHAYSNQAASGKASVTVIGANIGLSMYTTSVSLGITKCESSKWMSDSSLQGRAAQGLRATRRVSVTNGEVVGSNSQIFSYNVPVISAMNRGNTPGARPGTQL
jgi:hypothetical protein